VCVCVECVITMTTAYSKHEKVEEMESLLGMSLCEQLANKNELSFTELVKL